ncbi:hypothetical protein B0H66DRAFT_17806 [Apodospora peruviana]|uniref:Heterokaryon incompatibility domain-containing protein n=1 Tax=Apodospora peruviana TaxID=516989 RepID=A0AAE0MFM9_9PEZI|nr:hypothetical protein B0H66DRAFT_17806 [Apodospora peruviana]
MALNDHRYRQLEEGEFRLFLLNPSRSGTDDPLGELLTFKIDQPVRFCVLSFLWGSRRADDQANVLCGGGSGVKVPPNLVDALRTVHQRRQSQFFWADVLCINESAINERGTQAQMMAQILSKAESIEFYLNSESNSIKRLSNYYQG